MNCLSNGELSQYNLPKQKEVRRDQEVPHVEDLIKDMPNTIENPGLLKSGLQYPELWEECI